MFQLTFHFTLSESVKVTTILVFILQYLTKLLMLNIFVLLSGMI